MKWGCRDKRGYYEREVRFVIRLTKCVALGYSFVTGFQTEYYSCSLVYTTQVTHPIKEKMEDGC